MGEHEPPGPPRAVVAGHAGFPEGLVDAVERITGRGATLVVFSNIDLGRAEIENGIRRHVEQDGIRVIFTDLPGGSATLGARRVAHDYPDVLVVTGTNLVTLLDFVFADVLVPPQQAARAAVEKGRAALAAIPA